MSNAAQVKFQVNNLTNNVSVPSTGISFIMGRSERGPFADPSEVFNSWSRFRKIYGGLLDYSDSIHKVKRLLEKGGSVRFSRVGHYTTIADAGTLDAVKASPDDDILDTATELFEIVLKNPGADGNKFEVDVKVASNGDPDSFDLVVSHTETSEILENYINLKIVGIPTVAQSDYLKTITETSEFVNVVYKDLSGFIAPLSPDPVTVSFSGGTNGTAPSGTDYSGDSAGNNGYHAFNSYDDSYYLAIVDDGLSDAVHIAGAAYADSREDLFYLHHLSNAISTKTAMVSKRSGFNIDSKYFVLMAGGLKITDPISSAVKNIEAVTDALALACATDKNFGPWYSFAGHNRGVITDALGVVNNFGSSAMLPDLNDLANKQINMIINRNNKLMFWGNFSGQLSSNQESQLSIVKLVMFLKKSLKPTIESFIEDPNDIPTWRTMYYTVKPFLDSLVTKRAFYDYTWEGDQDAPNLETLSVNNSTDVTAGKYKVLLGIQAIPSIQEITIAISLTPAGVGFEVIQ